MEWQFLELPLFFSGERFYVGDLRWDVVARSTNSLLPSIGSLEILSGGSNFCEVDFRNTYGYISKKGTATLLYWKRLFQSNWRLKLGHMSSNQSWAVDRNIPPAPNVTGALPIPPAQFIPLSLTEERLTKRICCPSNMRGKADPIATEWNEVQIPGPTFMSSFFLLCFFFLFLEQECECFSFVFVHRWRKWRGERLSAGNTYSGKCH